MNDKYLLYLRWLITPVADRKSKEKTVADFCEYYEITPEEVVEFETAPNFYSDLEREARNWGIQKLPTIIQKAFEEASRTGKPAAVRAFKELISPEKMTRGSLLIFQLTHQMTSGLESLRVSKEK